MDKGNIAKEAIAASGGIAKTAELLAAGLQKWEIQQLKETGVLTGVRHGYYQLADDVDISEEKLLAELLPEGIVCRESALFHHGYSDFTPRVWAVAVPRSISPSKLKMNAFPFKAYYVPTSLHQIGKTEGVFNGVKLPVYNRERTICDCFKYRTKMDSEVFNKAIHAYVADEQKNLSKLSQCAKEMGVFKKMNELMGVMLNG